MIIIGGPMWSFKKKKRNFTSTSYDFCIPTPIMRLEVTIVAICKQVTKWDNLEYDRTPKQLGLRAIWENFFCNIHFQIWATIGKKELIVLP